MKGDFLSQQPPVFLAAFPRVTMTTCESLQINTHDWSDEKTGVFSSLRGNKIPLIRYKNHNYKKFRVTEFQILNQLQSTSLRSLIPVTTNLTDWTRTHHSVPSPLIFLKEVHEIRLWTSFQPTCGLECFFCQVKWSDQKHLVCCVMKEEPRHSENRVFLHQQQQQEPDGKSETL